MDQVTTVYDWQLAVTETVNDLLKTSRQLLAEVQALNERVKLLEGEQHQTHTWLPSEWVTTMPEGWEKGTGG